MPRKKPGLLTLRTAAFDNGRHGAGAKHIVEGLTESPERDLELALGWSAVRYLVEGHPDGKLSGAALQKVILKPYDAVPIELAAQRVRCMTVFMCDANGTWHAPALEALEDDTPFTPWSAASFIRDELASKQETMGLLPDVYGVLEALVGPDVVLTAIVEALESTPMTRLQEDDPKLLPMSLQIGRLLLRVHVDNEPRLRSRLARLQKKAAVDSEGRSVAAVLDRQIHGPRARTRSRSLDEIAQWNVVDPTVALDAIRAIELTRHSFSVLPRLAFVVGDAAVDLYRQKWKLLHDAGSQRRLVAEFGVLRLPSVPPLMAELALKSKAKKQAQAWLDAHPDADWREKRT